MLAVSCMLPLTISCVCTSGAAQKRETCASLPRLFPKPMNMRCVASAEAVPAVWGCWVESPGSEVSLM